MPHASIRRRALPALLALLCLGLLASLAPAPSATASPAGQPAGEAAVQAQAMLERVNQARREAGLPVYRANALLARAAQGHAEEIATHENFSHTGLDGRNAEQRVIDAGYGAGRAGLRVGENFVGRASVDEAFGWLMSDPPHRANIVDPDYREIGIGVGTIRWGFIWVMDLGTYDGIEEVLAQPQPTPSPEPEPTAEPTEPAAPEEPEEPTVAADPAATDPAGQPGLQPEVTETLPPAWTIEPDPVETPGEPPEATESPDSPDEGRGASPWLRVVIGMLLALAILMGASLLASRSTE